MGELSNRLKKEDVFYYSREVNKLLDLLTGIALYCEEKDKYKLKLIDMQLNKLESMRYKFEPTIYDEYSIKTSHAYYKMINAKKEYDRVINDKCYKSVIEEKKIIYKSASREYLRLKEYRNKLKEVLK